MQTEVREATVSKGALWTGRIMSGLVVAFLAMDGLMKVARAAPAIEVSEQLGIPASLVPGIGLTLLACTALYVFPRTAVLGAILLTGYLGGAVVTHVRMGGPAFSIIFPVVLGILVWGGVYLREPRLRALVPRRV